MSEETNKEPDKITIEDLLGDELFHEYVGKVLSETILRRVKRPKPEQGYKYKRDWYDRVDHSILNKEYILENMVAVLDKNFKGPRDMREVITYVCTEAYNRTYTHYKNQIEKEKNETT